MAQSIALDTLCYDARPKSAIQSDDQLKSTQLYAKIALFGSVVALGASLKLSSRRVSIALGALTLGALRVLSWALSYQILKPNETAKAFLDYYNSLDFESRTDISPTNQLSSSHFNGLAGIKGCIKVGDWDGVFVGMDRGDNLHTNLLIYSVTHQKAHHAVLIRATPKNHILRKNRIASQLTFSKAFNVPPGHLLVVVSPQDNDHYSMGLEEMKKFFSGELFNDLFDNSRQ